MKSRDEVENEQDEAAHDERVRHAGDTVAELIGELDPVTVHPTTIDHGGAIQVSYVISGEKSSQKVANQASYAMDGEDVQGVVNMKQELELGSVIACSSSNNTEYDGSPRRNETATGSDSDQASDDTTAEADCRPFAFQTIVENAPCEATSTGSKIRDDGSHDGAEIGGQSRTGIETEPAGFALAASTWTEGWRKRLPNPEEHCPDDNVSHVVWTVVKLMSAVATTFSEHQRVGQCSRARGNMHGCTSGKVETSQLVYPSRAVPGPASDWIVDNGRPNEREDHGRQHTTTFSGSTNGESDSDGSEHALVDSEHQIWNPGGANRRSCQDITEADVLEVADKFAGRMGESERVSPEEPLERDQGRGGNG